MSRIAWAEHSDDERYSPNNARCVKILLLACRKCSKYLHDIFCGCFFSRYVLKWLSFPQCFVIYAMWFLCFSSQLTNYLQLRLRTLNIKWINEREWQTERNKMLYTKQAHKTFCRIAVVHFASFLLLNIVASQ